MQHHVHAGRPAPHMRAAHLHGHGHMALAHPHPSMEQHLGTLTAAAAAAAAAAVVAAPVVTQQQQTQQQQAQAQATQREAYHGRLNHHHHSQQLTQPHTQSNASYYNSSSNNNNNNNNNSNQMQKIRQQHQHLSNSNGHLTKCNQGPPPPQAYNHLAAANAAAAAMSYGQLPHHMAHLGNYAAQAPPQAVLGAKQPHFYVSNDKPSKYNNSSNGGNSNSSSTNTANNNSINNNNNNNYARPSKTSLHNTYRSGKSNAQVLVATTETVTNTAAVVPTAAAPVEHALHNTLRSCRSGSIEGNLIVSESVDAAGELPPAEVVDNYETLPLTPTPSDDCSNNADLIDASGTLSNEDGTAGRSAKDKTPMCLVNELARYNKITHQYRLTGERGPAHCKTFTVTLKLGEEEYSADGFKIKKAQHLAASKAIEETKYKHPPPKIRRNDESSSTRTHITPTVELNALAMKLGQRTYYLLDPTTMRLTDTMVPPEFVAPLLPTPGPGMPAPATAYHVRRSNNGTGGYIITAPPMPPPHPQMAIQPQRGIYGHQRPFLPKYQSRYPLTPPLGPHMMPGPHGPYAPSLPVTPSKITLFVGKQKFVGIGRTLQQAKHDAAARALQVLKSQANSAADEALDESLDESDKKSPISQVHEIGIKHNMTVHFKVLREEGPAHMKNFITACVVGSIVTEGHGNGKKLSKKRAAEKMLIELQKLPPLTPTKQTPMKRIKVKTPGKGGAANAVVGVVSSATTLQGKPERRKRNVPAKEKPVAADLDDADNPITKLIQLQQTRKGKEPIFELVGRSGNESSRRREFVMEVSASGSTARGTGNSKKLAKRNAAQALLELLESTELNSTAVDPTIDSKVINVGPVAAAAGSINEPNTVLDLPMVTTPAGAVPGILILRQNKKPAKKKDAVNKVSAERLKDKESKTDVNVKTTTGIEVKCSSSRSSSSKESVSNINETVSSGESNLNISTGSNTSGVSSNSSNVSASNHGSSSNASSSGDSNISGTSGGVAGSSSGLGSGGVHMKEQLVYLSKLLDFEVNFSDYPKGNHSEFLTIVTLSTNPPQICHGVGTSCEESQNAAARNALKILSELGLNNAKK